jgi:bacterioferritin-associated ferredoxin
MIICVCNAVSDRHIKAAVKDGAVSMRDITRRLRVGTCCGMCVAEARAVLDTCRSQCSASHSDDVSPSYFRGATPEFAV